MVFGSLFAASVFHQHYAICFLIIIVSMRAALAGEVTSRRDVRLQTTSGAARRPCLAVCFGASQRNRLRANVFENGAHFCQTPQQAQKKLAHVCTSPTLLRCGWLLGF